jgi:amino acid adenylation domain-containing protein
MLVQDFLQDSADRLPEKIALVCDNQRLTYDEVERMANRLANALRSWGVKRGDRVAIYLPNSIPSVVGVFAALKAGGVFVVVNSTTKQDKLIGILNNCEATALVTTGRNRDLAQAVLAAVPSIKLCVLSGPLPQGAVMPVATGAGAMFLQYEDIQRVMADSRPPRVNIDLDLACLIYTSGSTGEPKGVMSDHSNVVFAAGSIIEYLHNVESDIVIGMLPLSFDYGLYQLLMVFKFGGTLVLERSFTYPAAILKRIQDERVTGFPGVPTIYAMLLNMDLSEFDLSSLRYLSNTAAALPPSHIQQLRAKFPWATIYSMYGLTETKRTLYLPPEQLDRRADSVGIPIPGTECWVVDDQGNRLPPCEVGELVVRGRHVMRGYWEDPAMTAQRYRPGLLPGERLCYTGDLFRMDQEGFFYFVGRKDDIIKTRGEKVAPKEVEAVLYRLDGIVEAAVVGIPDPVLGEAVKAVVVADRGQLSEAQILAHCRANLEDFMIPQTVEIRDELPKTPSGKIDKKPLK